LTDLPETDPEHVYCILQGAGIIRAGRPIRGNFYCYRLDRKHDLTLARLMGLAPGHIRDERGLARFLETHGKPWSNKMDIDGYPLTALNRRFPNAAELPGSYQVPA